MRTQLITLSTLCVTLFFGNVSASNSLSYPSPASPSPSSSIPSAPTISPLSLSGSNTSAEHESENESVVQYLETRYAPLFDETKVEHPVYDAIYEGAKGYPYTTRGDIRTRNALAYCLMRDLYANAILALPEPARVPFPVANILDCSDNDLKEAKKVLDRTMEIVMADVDGRFNKAWHIAGDYSMLEWGTSDLRKPIDNFLSLNPISTLLFSSYEDILLKASSIEEHNEYFEMIFEESWADRLQSFYSHFKNVLENITAAFSNEPRRIFGNQVWRKKFVEFLNMLETRIKPMSPAQLSHITSEWEGRGACDVAVTNTLKDIVKYPEPVTKPDVQQVIAQEKSAPESQQVDYNDIERKMEYLSLKHVNDIVLFYPYAPIITTNAAQSSILKKTQAAIRKEIDGYDRNQYLGEDKMEFIKYVNRDFYPNHCRIVEQYRDRVEHEQKAKGENANLGPINDDLNAQLDPLFKKLNEKLDLAFPPEESQA